MTPDKSPEPLVISRCDHSISRKNIDREALKVMHRLRDAGFSAYLVGGGVRDLYLGKTPKDFDISTNARPGQIRKIFRNSRVIGRRFRLVQVFFKGEKIVEVSTLRRSSEHDIQNNEQVLPANNTYGTLVEDAFRRDLTINALFYEIENFTVIDYTGGVADLNHGIVRIVGEPQRRITRDPVRMLRAIRHAARTGFSIEEKSWQAICENRAMLTLCPESRIRDEIFKDLRGGASHAWAQLAIASGIFFVVFPFYKKILSNNSGQSDDFEQKEFRQSKGGLGQLLNVLAVIDRLRAEEVELPEHIVVALLLVPWALVEMDLLAAPTIGKELFAFSRKVRSRLAEMLAHLNIKRVLQEEITGLLVNLPIFIQHDKGGAWPKGLTRKSYFNDGLQFYQIYKEVCGGKKVASVSFAAVVKEPKLENKKRPPHRGDRLPAFAHNTGGGIFGFKKRR
ncbi:MAG: poly(A) polymerase [Proteobacteria bacterium]|nr:poly(A) polymerase [Pseudomonadota bacterium]MBU1714915.1 poly(A) polymerase [Pseudomonadota bacterium]